MYVRPCKIFLSLQKECMEIYKKQRLILDIIEHGVSNMEHSEFHKYGLQKHAGKATLSIDETLNHGCILLFGSDLVVLTCTLGTKSFSCIVSLI